VPNETAKETPASILKASPLLEKVYNHQTLSIAELTEAIRLNPNFALAYYNRANTYLDHKNQYDRAIADYSAAIRLNPNLSETYFYRNQI